MATTNPNFKKDVKQEDILLTEEQYDIIRRRKTKESVNRVLRVLGLFAASLIIYVGVLDPFFEISFFGRIFTKDTYLEYWGTNVNGFGGLWQKIATSIEDGGLGIYDDKLLGFGSFLPKFAITIMIVLTVLGLVYLLTYNIIDLVGLIKGMISSAKGISRDISLNVYDGVSEIKGDKKPSTKKKNIFKGEDVTPEEKNNFKKGKTTKQPEKKTVRREDNSNLGGLTPEQLDALLLGEDIEMPEEPVTRTDNGEKNIFDE